MRKRPPLRVAFAIVGVILAAALYGAAYVAGGLTLHPVRRVSVPAYCRDMAACVRETVAAQAAGQDVYGGCDKTSGGYLCSLTLEDQYATKTCYAVTVSAAKEGYPLIDSANETTC